jgi:RNA polymerase sigma-70 factor (ECF subfamily)
MIIELTRGVLALRSTDMLAVPVTLFDALSRPVRRRRRASATPPGPRTVRGMAGDEDDDAALMQAWGAGDMRAFETLYARHKGPLYRYLMRHTRQRELADDLFQETWGRLIGARQRYEPRARFQTFLFTLAHNLFIDHCRRASVRPVSASSLPVAPGDDDDPHDERGVGAIRAPEPEQPERRAEEQETAARIRAALEALPREQRDVFLLYEETGLTLEEIGQVTGVGTETAKSRLRYAVAKLRAAMSDLAPASLERSP